MEPEGSLPCSQKSATGPYPESDECNSHTYFTNNLFNIIILSTPTYSESCAPSRLSIKILYAFIISVCPVNLILLDLIIAVIFVVLLMLLT